jgi:hypothetical protein
VAFDEKSPAFESNYFCLCLSLRPVFKKWLSLKQKIFMFKDYSITKNIQDDNIQDKKLNKFFPAAPFK